jgi:hypothetical protein
MLSEQVLKKMAEKYRPPPSAVASLPVMLVSWSMTVLKVFSMYKPPPIAPNPVALFPLIVLAWMVSAAADTDAMAPPLLVA